HRVDLGEQLLDCVIGANAQLPGHLRRPLGIRLEKPRERRACHVLQDARVVKTERPCPHDTDAHAVRAHTVDPRSLACRKLMSASTSGIILRSVFACSIACEMFSSERKNNRYAFFSSAMLSASNPRRCNPTLLSP